MNLFGSRALRLIARLAAMLVVMTAEAEQPVLAKAHLEITHETARLIFPGSSDRIKVTASPDDVSHDQVLVWQYESYPDMKRHTIKYDQIAPENGMSLTSEDFTID